jgi:hypothetical protein
MVLPVSEGPPNSAATAWPARWPKPHSSAARCGAGGRVAAVAAPDWACRQLALSPCAISVCRAATPSQRARRRAGRRARESIARRARTDAADRGPGGISGKPSDDLRRPKKLISPAVVSTPMSRAISLGPRHPGLPRGPPIHSALRRACRQVTARSVMVALALALRRS